MLEWPAAAACLRKLLPRCAVAVSCHVALPNNASAAFLPPLALRSLVDRHGLSRGRLHMLVRITAPEQSASATFPERSLVDRHGLSCISVRCFDVVTAKETTGRKMRLAIWHV